MGRQIGKGATFLGVPLVKARNVLKAWRHGGTANAFDICTRKDVNLSAPVTAMLLQEFEDRGLIGDEKTPIAGDVFKGLTEAGTAFITASGRARAPRAKAQAVLDALLKRCSDLSKDDAAPYHASRIWLYGSMTRDTPDVGDIDLVVTCKWSPAYAAITDEGKRHDAAQRYARKHLPDGALPNGLALAAAAQILFGKQVFGDPRHPLLSPGSPDDLVKLACPCKLVFDSSAGGPVDGPVLNKHPDAGERHPSVAPAPEMPDLLPPAGPLKPIDAAYGWEVDLHFNKNRDLGIFDPESKGYYGVVQARHKFGGAFVVDSSSIDDIYNASKATAALKKVKGIDGIGVAGLIVPPPRKLGKAAAIASYVVEREITQGSNAATYTLGLRTLEAVDLGFAGHASAILPVLANAAADIVRIARRDDEAGIARPIVVELTTAGKFSNLYGMLFEAALERPEAWLGQGSDDILPRLQVSVNGSQIDLENTEEPDGPRL